MTSIDDKAINHIDINCDLGEGHTIIDCEKDALLMPFISSCNIASGGHAGNETTIVQSLINAKKNQLKVGLHPGYPDPRNFGRHSLSISITDLKLSLIQQITTMTNFSLQQNVTLHHLKLHGALYNDCEKKPEITKLIIDIMLGLDANIKVLGLAGGLLQQACTKNGINFIAEGFMDRTYLANGTLTPRNLPGSILSNSQLVMEQALALAKHQPIATSDKQFLTPIVTSICLHGDNTNALVIAKLVSQAMRNNGIKIQ